MNNKVHLKNITPISDAVFRFSNIFIIILFICGGKSFSQYKHFIIVAQDGSGDFRTLTEAVESLPMFNYERVTINIKDGVYNEKIRIEQNNITLKGENREKTIIRFSQLRSDWDNNKDAIGPAVINIFADDIVIENLTIENSQPEIGPHAFTIYGMGTRIILTNCTVLSKGGDTVSLWNYKNGMYYHSDCTFKGAVDFVCPRGWCYIKNSKFYEEKPTASMWHAGGYNIDQKFVIVNSSFDGVEGFQLGRHHYEAQFYFLNCTFSENMADKPVYRVSYPGHPEKDRPFNWGERDYFFNCSKSGINYNWFQNNLSSASGPPFPSEITPLWTFDGRWDPESSTGPKVIKYEIHKGFVLLFFNEHLTVTGNPVLKSNSGVEFIYNSGGGSDTLRFDCDENYSDQDLRGLSITNNAKVFGNTASLNVREASFNFL